MFHQELCILSVQRHSINRRVVFVFLLQNTKEFVASQPKRVPHKIILARNTNCLFAGEIDFPSRAHVGSPNASLFSSAFFTKRKPEPSALTKPRCHSFSAIIENASFDPSGDQTGPKQLSLGISFKILTLPVPRSAIAM